MKTVLWTIKNIIKITLWILLLSYLMNYLGVIYGSVVFAFICLVWNIILTMMRTYRLSGRDGFLIILKTLFSKQFYLPFIVYGCFCSPRYGVNWETQNLLPIDGLDEACKRHDEAMFNADRDLISGLITKREHATLKNIGDWRFIKEAITSKNFANGVYLIGLLIGFFSRLLGRTIKKYFYV